MMVLFFAKVRYTFCPSAVKCLGSHTLGRASRHPEVAFDWLPALFSPAKLSVSKQHLCYIYTFLQNQIALPRRSRPTAQRDTLLARRASCNRQLCGLQLDSDAARVQREHMWRARAQVGRQCRLAARWCHVRVPRWLQGHVWPKPEVQGARRLFPPIPGFVSRGAFLICRI